MLWTLITVNKLSHMAWAKRIPNNNLYKIFSRKYFSVSPLKIVWYCHTRLRYKVIKHRQKTLSSQSKSTKAIANLFALHKKVIAELFWAAYKRSDIQISSIWVVQTFALVAKYRCMTYSYHDVNPRNQIQMELDDVCFIIGNFPLMFLNDNKK